MNQRLDYIAATTPKNMLQNKVVKMTPNQLFQEYMPGLTELTQAHFGGKVAYAVVKNYQLGDRAVRAIEKDRLDILRQYVQFDEKGAMVINNDEGVAPGTPRFKSPEAEQQCRAEVNRLGMEGQYDVSVHVVPASLINDMPNIRPAVLLMTQCMWEDAPEKESVDSPDQTTN